MDGLILGALYVVAGVAFVGARLLSIGWCERELHALELERLAELGVRPSSVELGVHWLAQRSGGRGNAWRVCGFCVVVWPVFAFVVAAQTLAQIAALSATKT